MSTAARVLAMVLALAALVPLIWLRFAMPYSGGGGGSVGNGLEADYSYGELTTGFHLLAIALAMLVAIGAAGLWRGRGPWVRIAGVIAGGLGLALTPVAAAASRPDLLTPTAERAIRNGMTRDQVKEIAGRPSGTGEAITDSGHQLDCLLYHLAADDFASHRLFCFDGDRLVERSL